MSTDERAFIHTRHKKRLQTALEAEVGGFEQRGDWAEIPGEQGALEAQLLSKRLGVYGVFWSIQTAVDQIWLQAFSKGRLVRELRYTADEGWAEWTGKALAFEQKELLEAYRKRDDLAARMEGYEIREAFLGLMDEPDAPIVDPEGDTLLFFTTPVADELRQLMRDRGCSAGAVLEAVWEKAKAELHREPDYDGKRLPPPPPREVAVSICDDEERTVDELPSPDGKLEVHAALPKDVGSEVRALAFHLDRTLSWVLGQAFQRSRPYVVR